MAIKGHVDGMLGCYVIGWALAVPDTGNCAITIVDEQGEVIGKGRASRHRADLASLGAGRTTLSFRIAIKNPPEPRRLRVLANGEELAHSPILTGSGQYDGDATLDKGSVSGWVTERVTGFEPPVITAVNQYGDLVGQAQSRRDPNEQDPEFAPAYYHLELDDRCFGCGEFELSIRANGVEFAKRSGSLRLEGNLEAVTANSCSGWLVSPDIQQRCFEFEVYRNGELAGTARCDVLREDVRDRYSDCTTAGFSAELSKSTHAPTEAVTISCRFPGSDVDLFQGPYVVAGQSAAILAAQRAARLAYQSIDGIGAAERAAIQLAIDEFLISARTGRGFVASQQALGGTVAASRPRISIIIPVYRGVDVTLACVQSVLAHRNPATDQIILVNDASPDEEMAPMLLGFAGLQNVFLLNNESNLGFVKSVNRGLSFARGNNVLLLNSDTVLFAGGLDEMCRVADAAADIATVTAMSSNATIFSYPHAELRSETLDDIAWPELAALALLENAGVTVDVPTGHGFCLLIKGEVLRRVGTLDEGFGRGYGEENDFCMRAANLGYRHVLAAGALVQHRESISFTGEKTSLLAQNLPRLNAMYPEYTPLIMNFEDEDGVRSGRWALDRARLESAARKGQEFVLLVTNTLEGGTAQAIKDIEETAGYSGATKLTLRSQKNGFIELLADKPAIWATFSPEETDELFAVISAARPKRVLVHQLLGFPESFIRELSDWARVVPMIFYAHDFYSICPRVTMIDAIGRFCDVADTDTCARCVEMDGSHVSSRLTELTPAEHRALFAATLSRFRHVIAPSENAAGYLRRCFPQLEVKAIPHPERIPDGALTPRAGDNEEILLLGAIGPHKGSAKLLEIAQRARLTHPRLQFRIIGYTDIDRQLKAIGNVTITGKYKPEELPELIGKCTGRLALFLSSWPETYSYTLTEVAKHGFIPMVPDIGAPAERVRDAGYGVVFPFPINPAEVLDVIANFASGKLQPFAKGAGPAKLYPKAEAIAKSAEVLGLKPKMKKAAVTAM